MPDTTARTAMPDGTTKVLIGLLCILLIVIGVLPHVLPVAAPPWMFGVMRVLVIATGLGAIGGHVLRRAWAPWTALTAVGCGATIACFAVAAGVDRWLLAVIIGVVGGVGVLLFRVGAPPATTIGACPRVLYAAVFAFAGWVAYWGWLHPATAGVLPINPPPLHARFLAAMYFSGCVFMALAAFARGWAEQRIVTFILAVWTGGLGIVSVLNFGVFDWARDPTWFWFFAYIAFPLAAAWLAWNQRGQRAHPAGSLPWMTRAILVLVGSAATALGVLLLVAPRQMIALWPWAITVVLAQVYSAPFLAYGIGCLCAARRHGWAEIRIPVAGTFAFAAGVLVASWLHAGLFNPNTPSAWIWFGGFGFVGLALPAASAIARSSRTGEPAGRHAP